MNRILIKHVGGMGDFVILVPPLIAIMRERYPGARIAVLTAWSLTYVKRWRLGGRFGVRRPRVRLYGDRAQGGYCISLINAHPDVHEVIHWHDERSAPEGGICTEDGRSIPTWNRRDFEARSLGYDLVLDVDAVGLGYEGNPIDRVLVAHGQAPSGFTDYRLPLSDADHAKVAPFVATLPRPTILIAEGIEKREFRGWDPTKLDALRRELRSRYGTEPIAWGASPLPGVTVPLSLREQAAFAAACDLSVGVLSGPQHLAAAVGTPTVTLYGMHRPERAEIACHLNPYIGDPTRRHRTVAYPGCQYCGPKPSKPCPVAPPNPSWVDWQQPGEQRIKSCIAMISLEAVLSSVDEALCGATNPVPPRSSQFPVT